MSLSPRSPSPSPSPGSSSPHIVGASATQSPEDPEPVVANQINLESPGSPPGSRGGQKRVNWILPAQDEAEDDTTEHDNVEPIEDPEAAEPSGANNSASEQRARSEFDNDLKREISDAELRDRVHQIFSRTPPTTFSRQHSDDGSPGNSKPARRGRSLPGKPVLRKGHRTLGGTPSVSPPPTEQRQKDHQRKTEAAANAHRAAEGWSRSVDTSPEPPQHRRRRKHARPTLYHAGISSHSNSPGTTTPDIDPSYYIPRPDRYRVSGLSALGMLEKFRGTLHLGGDSASDSGGSTPHFRPRSLPGSAQSSPRGSVSGIGGLIASSSILGSQGYSDIHKARTKDLPKRPASLDSRSTSSNVLDTLTKMQSYWRPTKEEQARIKNHVQETASRQRYLLKLCHALMMFGAPTHRLEQYMNMSARVLETEAQFLYMPGCMIVSFDDSRTHTTEVKLVRNTQGIDLGKIRDTHNVYKDVVHDLIGVEEALERLEEIVNRPPKFSTWLRVFVYGLASVGVGPYAFSARLIDLPIAFVLGCILGFLQLIVAPKTELYSNVFEIMAVMITSFLARAFGSIKYGDGRLFCFSALAQSSIALILPGYIVLCGALELQSRSIVAGSVRLVYAIIYSLFIGYGLTLGTAIYGVIDGDATSETVCPNALSNDSYWIFFFVPLFAVCLMVINQAKWKQMPVMTLIAFGGYLVSYFSSHRFIGNSQVTSTLAALAVGVMANLYSRIGLRIETLLSKPVSKIQSKLRTIFSPSSDSRSVGPSSLEKQSDETETTESGSFWNKVSKAIHGSPPRVKLSPPQSSDSESSGNEKTEEKTENSNEKKPEKAPQVNYSLASAAMLPAIFVLVPSGLSVSGSLVQGIRQADTLVHNVHNSGGVATASAVTTGNFGNGIAFNVGYSVVQVAIGITVGLLFGSLVVYPFGKGGKVGSGRGMRSGLFSF